MYQGRIYTNTQRNALSEMMCRPGPRVPTHSYATAYVYFTIISHKRPSVQISPSVEAGSVYVVPKIFNYFTREWKNMLYNLFLTDADRSNCRFSYIGIHNGEYTVLDTTDDKVSGLAAHLIPLDK